MDNEQYYKEAMNKLTDPEDKEELEFCWHCFNDEGTYTPVEFKNGTMVMGDAGYLCWEFPQWLEATCFNPTILKTLGLTGKYLLKIELLSRLRDLHLPPEEDEYWSDLITQDNVDVSKLELALKNLEISERKQALAEDFKKD